MKTGAQESKGTKTPNGRAEVRRKVRVLLDLLERQGTPEEKDEAEKLKARLSEQPAA